MTCNWSKEDYFSLLMCGDDKRSHTALEMLVDDLHTDKDRSITTFLCHSGSEDFLWGLVHLLGSDNSRVAGNAAYIIGTLAESELGCSRVLSLPKSSAPESKKILSDLTRMLTFDDSESVMNAAGTMGTLAESHEGREWILKEPCLEQTLEHITALLHSENMWTASNAALVLARLSISEGGCTEILKHKHSQHILSKLVMSLGVDEAGRGMNAAFAIGRLCDLDTGRKRLLALTDSERMISSLAKMLSCDDTGASKNACFALSCLATNSEGHGRILNNVHSEDILRTLSDLLSAEDSETGWFAAMTLRTLASQPKGCLRLRDHPQVLPALKEIDNKEEMNPDLKEEVSITLEILKKLVRPHPPQFEVLKADTIIASWEPTTTKSGFLVRYQLFEGMKCVYTGKDLKCEIKGLHPNTQYTYKLRAYTEGDESPFSDPVHITTEESVPSPPQNVRVLGSTITQLKIGWDPPEEFNGVFKGYSVIVGDKVEHTTENSIIITGLTANTMYEVEVCAATVKGKGEKAMVVAYTAEIGAHAPSKPVVTVLGRNELHLQWDAPEVPLGRFNRYDVVMNNKVIYSGTDHYFTVRRLTPDTEYSFVVVALTTDGKFESKVARKRTAKDEYDSNRPPLYQPPRKNSVDDTSKEGSKTPVTNTVAKKKESKVRAKSGRRTGTPKDRPKTPADVDTRPCSEQMSRRAIAMSPVLLASVVSIVGVGVSLALFVYRHPAESSMSSQVSAKDREPNTQATSSHHMKQSRPVSKTKTSGVKAPQKLDRSLTSNKMFPLNVSYVSIQGEKDKENTQAKTPDMDTANIRKSFTRTSTTLESQDVNKGLKMERSKTFLSGEKDYKKTWSPSHKHFGKGQRAIVEKPEVENERFSAGRRTGNIPEKAGYQGTLNSPDLIVTSKDRSKMSGTHDGRRGTGKVRDSVLPRPSIPSQQYLDGGVAGQVTETPWLTQSQSSPRGSKDFNTHRGEATDAEWLSQVKRVSENVVGSMRLHQANLLPSNPHDSTYFIETPSDFLQRTNTYVSSHRPGNRRSLDKIPRQSPPNKGGMQLGSSMNFELEVPENHKAMTRLSNKFVPMQLRTQPSNLGIGQLQRVNTTLLGDYSGDTNVQFRRLEAITRSQTQVDMSPRQPPMSAQPVLGLDEELGGNARLGVVTVSNAKHSGRERNHPARKSLSSTSQKVTRTVVKKSEPDSVLLQQSWGITSSSEASLQSAR